MKQITAFILLFSALVSLHAQNPAARDTSKSIYIKQAITERVPVAWPPLPERDVFICKRVERIIDTREKMNLSMRYPQLPLMDIIYKGIAEGKLTAYKNDSLSSAMDPEYAMMVGARKIHVSTQNSEDEFDVTDDTLTQALTAGDFKKFKIIEDWIFDRNTGEQYTRIRAIAPLYEMNVSNIALGDQAAFYLSYRECRYVFVNNEVFNRQNDGGRLSFDDFFEQRLFSSYITKTSNVFDLAIKDFEEYQNDPKAALHEADDQNNNLTNIESDMWEH
jgi:gliding motility associated protien GldN